MSMVDHVVENNQLLSVVYDFKGVPDKELRAFRSTISQDFDDKCPHCGASLSNLEGVRCFIRVSDPLRPPILGFDIGSGKAVCPKCENEISIQGELDLNAFPTIKCSLASMRESYQMRVNGAGRSGRSRRNGGGAHG